MDPVGTTYASAENVRKTSTPRQSTTTRSTVWRMTPEAGSAWVPQCAAGLGSVMVPCSLFQVYRGDDRGSGLPHGLNLPRRQGPTGTLPGKSRRFLPASYVSCLP